MTPAARRFVTIIVHTDGTVESRRLRLPLWLARAALAASLLLALGLLLGIALYAPIVRTAARVPGMEREIARLSADNQQVRQLAARLARVEQRYDQVRSMLGGDIVPPRSTGGGPLAVAYPVVARVPGEASAYERGPSLPTHWPLDDPGVITQGQVNDPGGSRHPGLDIAVPSGTPIRAAGGGTVSEAGDDPEYGQFVRITHPDGYESMYGHAARLLVAPGQFVEAGQVIGLSGSTGRSSGPHLHFEIRQSGRVVDPRSLLKGRM
jgi:murein DD-endopeptidase MepM/ murein hydrolase activator NlpD